MGSIVKWDTEERISELDDGITEIAQPEQQKENRLKKQNRAEPQGPTVQ